MEFSNTEPSSQATFLWGKGRGPPADYLPQADAEQLGKGLLPGRGRILKTQRTLTSFSLGLELFLGFGLLLSESVCMY